jgi:hypothetical protein
MLVPGLLTVPLECRHADGFSFRAVGRPRARLPRGRNVQGWRHSGVSLKFRSDEATESD